MAADRRWRAWFPVERRHRQVLRRICPVCATDPDRGIPWTAAVPLTLTCPEHECRLEAEHAVRLAQALEESIPHRAAPKHLLDLDRLTHHGLATGTVSLPRRGVHLGVWLRLLRTLLDEVSISTSRVGKRSTAALEQIWDTAGWPLRAGISVWRPYEIFDIERQETMLEAAATAVNLISTGQIVAQGGLGQLLSVQPHQPVYAGDQPSAAELVGKARIEAIRQSWAKAQQEFDDWFATARTDPAVARQIFGIFSHYSRTREAYDAERDFMIRHGIPASFLPDPEPGRFGPANAVR